jgi:hypothetical protein
MKTSYLVAALFAVFTLHSGLQAALITVNGTLTVDADDGASFKAGDKFAYSFTFDDQTIGVPTGSGGAQFQAGVSAFSLTRYGSNAGTWNPASGTFNVSPLKNMVVNANSDQITLQATGSGFPDLNGVAFFDVELAYSFSGVYNFFNEGPGQPFSEWVGSQMRGGSPLNFAMASSQYAQIRAANFQSPTLSASVIAGVPEPGTWAAAALLAGGAGFMRWRKRAKVA